MLGSRPNFRWLTAVAVVIVAVVAVWWLGRDGDDPVASGNADQPSSETTSAPSVLPEGATPNATPSSGTTEPVPEMSSSGEGTVPHASPSEGKKRGKESGTSPSSAPSPSGVACMAGADRVPISPVPGDADLTEVRQRVASNLQLLREMSAPAALADDVEGLRSYYRRVGEIVGIDGQDSPVTPKDRSRIDQLTQDVYARFAPPVIDFLTRRC